MYEWRGSVVRYVVLVRRKKTNYNYQFNLRILNGKTKTIRWRSQKFAEGEAKSRIFRRKTEISSFGLFFK